MRLAGAIPTGLVEDLIIARLPGIEQGPAQGYHTPIKNYGGVFMPDGSQNVNSPRRTPMGVPLFSTNPAVEDAFAQERAFSHYGMMS